MKNRPFLIPALYLLFFFPVYGQKLIKEYDIQKKYLNIPVNMKQGRQKVIFVTGKDTLTYDGGYNRFNDTPYVCDMPGSFRFKVEMLIDKTSVGTYIGNGKLFLSGRLLKKNPGEGFRIKGDVLMHTLEVSELKSIW